MISKHDRSAELIAPGYALTTLAEVVEGHVAQTGPTRAFVYLDIGSIDREAKALREQRLLELDEAPSRARQIVAPGDVLVSMTRPNLNAVAMVPCSESQLVASTGFHVLRTRWVEPKFLYYLVQTDHFIDTMSSLVQGALYPAVRPRDISNYKFMLPPKSEQYRIVKKLEELFSDLDAGVTELKVLQRKLEQYRQSLLKAAMEGALTADWRMARIANRRPREIGTDLLQSILTDRRAHWEAKQLAKFIEQGKTPPGDWRNKYPEPISLDTTDFSELPEGWVWATLSQIGWLDRGRSKHRPRNAPHLYGGPYPFVQTGDIRDSDTFVRKASITYSEAGLAQSRLWPTKTLCITIAANIGKTALLAVEACFPDSVVGFLPASDAVSVEYVEYYIRTAQQKLEDEAPATAQKNINLEILERLPVPIPPMHEQLLLVERLSDSLSSVRDQDEAAALGIRQASAQRKNILRAAFAGQLVPQEPSDEPASVLLDRIRGARVAVAEKPKTKNARQKKERA
ncbi:restriction endonuclease subunit S [Pinirhizobacter sp.]|uniref:restriction endonuclease subunit S n=1 Tax=Pinirhizobacter sp. TaxID=2950432 RepID=UPI002F401358